MGQLDGKIAIITGAGTGIGKGIARAFAREGADLVLASRNQANLDETAQEIGQYQHRVRVIPTDVTDEAAVIALFEQTMAVFGRIDILINNSGAFDGGPFEELSLATWQKVVNVNLTGPFLCAREAMKLMKRQGGGRIINIGSISAQMCRPNAAPYNTTKHALVGLTKSIALEGRDFNVVASVLHPGNVLTERRAASSAAQDAEPMMTVDELALAAVTMAALPLHVNVFESIVLPTQQKYLGRG
ncbi:MAG: SDR family oxidoreductase [Caldilineaceae bacterium]|nr:SDR family oxidoreductase [Caldilineaceae bacterium]